MSICLQTNYLRFFVCRLSLQISYLQLDTKDWFASLDSVDYIAISCKETKNQARKKRMKSALTEDANAAVTHQRTDSNGTQAVTEVSCTNSEKEGVFVGGLPFQRLSSLNLKGMAGGVERSRGLSVSTDIDNVEDVSRYRLDSFCGSISKEATAKLTSLRKFSFESSFTGETMNHSTSLSSFVELFTDDLRATKPLSTTASSTDLNAPTIDAADDDGKQEEFEVSGVANPQADSEVDTIIDEAIDSVIESSTMETEFQGLFLKEISKFLRKFDCPFQHVDIWVPMDVSHSDAIGKNHIGGSSTMTRTNSRGVSGIIYGGRQSSSVRLSNAGYISVKSSPQITNQLNEVSMLSSGINLFSLTIL